MLINVIITLLRDLDKKIGNENIEPQKMLFKNRDAFIWMRSSGIFSVAVCLGQCTGYYKSLSFHVHVRVIGLVLGRQVG